MGEDGEANQVIDRRRLLGMGAAAVATVGAVVATGQSPVAAAKKKPPKKKPKPTLIGSLQIPKLGINMGLFQGMDTLNLNAGPSHWPGTPFPGQDGNVVVAGHRTSRHKVFRNIDRLAAGDTVVFSMPNGVFTYRVTTPPYLVNPKRDAAAVLAQPVGRHATLFACHPPGSTRQRIVVRADLV